MRFPNWLREVPVSRQLPTTRQQFRRRLFEQAFREVTRAFPGELRAKRRKIAWAVVRRTPWEGPSVSSSREERIAA
jgi:hypothetical protein